MESINGVPPSPDKPERSAEPPRGTSGQAFRSALDRHIASEASTNPGTAASTVHTIRSGDTLSDVVKKRMDTLGMQYETGDIYRQVRMVAAANKIDDPDRVYVDQRIDLSAVGRELVTASGGPATHTIPAQQPAKFTAINIPAPPSPLPRPSSAAPASLTLGAPEAQSTQPQSPQPQDATQEYLLPATGRLTSGYGTRNDPFTGAVRFHHGIDIALSRGTPVGSVASGDILFVGRRGGYGHVVEIDHGRGETSLYAHLGETSVTAGQAIERGQVIGLSGSSGRSTGPHLHFEIRRDGNSIDPATVLPVDTLPVGVEKAIERGVIG